MTEDTVSDVLDSYDALFIDLVLRADPKYQIPDSCLNFSQYLAYTMQDAMDLYNTANDEEELVGIRPGGLSLGAAMYMCYELNKAEPASLLTPWHLKSAAFQTAFRTIALVIRNTLRLYNHDNLDEDSGYKLHEGVKWQYLDDYDEELKVLLSDKRFEIFKKNKN